MVWSPGRVHWVAPGACWAMVYVTGRSRWSSSGSLSVNKSSTTLQPSTRNILLQSTYIIHKFTIQLDDSAFFLTQSSITEPPTSNFYQDCSLDDQNKLSHQLSYIFSSNLDFSNGPSAQNHPFSLKVVIPRFLFALSHMKSWPKV